MGFLNLVDPLLFPLSSKRVLLFGESICVIFRILVEYISLAAVLIRDTRLERVIRVGLDEQLAHGLEHLAQLGGGLPVLGFEGRDANVARAVVGHVRMVDARVEGDERGLEGVVVGQANDKAEEAAAVRGVVGPCEVDVPGLEVGFGGEGYGQAGDLVGLALG